MPHQHPYFKSQSPNTLKRYVEFLAVCKDPVACKAVLQRSPDTVIKCICNAALNAQQGDIQLTKKQIKALSKHRKKISILTNKNRDLKSKRKVLVQKGGAAFLPVLLGTILASLGSAIFSRKE